MFSTYYGLAFNPFDKQQTAEKDRFHSKDSEEMIQRLDYLKDTRGIGVFTAPPGMGKTFALRCFAKSLNPNLYKMEYICLSTVSVAEFYKQFCLALGVDTKGGKPGMFKSIQEQVYYLYRDKRQPLLLAVDEAQYLSTAILNDIRMLMNYGYDSLNCFSLILCGEPHLNNTLRRPVHEALRQRVTVHYNFQGLSDQEVADYILHKISCAGGSQGIIEAAALSAVHSHSQGNPRVIDNLMTNALMLGAQMEQKSITPDVILAAVSSQNLV